MTRRHQFETASIALIAVIACGIGTQKAAAQHLDVLFSYENEKIDIQQQPDSRGLVYAGNFPTTGIERQFTTLPGFASETDVGLGIGTEDELVYNILDNLIYWDGNDFAPPSDGAQIRVENNPPGTPDTVVTSTSGEQLGSFSPPVNRIAAAGSSGDFHRDLAWFLEPQGAPSPPPEGAYGLKLTLSTDEPGISDSDPLFFVFNFGLDATTFDSALGAFADLLAPTLPGDFDSDGDVDSADRTTITANWTGALEPGVGMSTSGQGDADGDGDVDSADLTILVTNWTGAMMASPATSKMQASIPEPTTEFLLGVAATILFAGRRVRRRYQGRQFSHS